MDQSQVLEQLTDVFRDVFNDETLVLTSEMTAVDVPEWDSFNHINLVVATEVRFGVKFKTAELEKLKNVGEYVELLAEKLKQK
jgi:acyl carrier protein